jgi:hypothetical protein
MFYSIPTAKCRQLIAGARDTGSKFVHAGLVGVIEAIGAAQQLAARERTHSHRDRLSRQAGG